MKRKSSVTTKSSAAVTVGLDLGDRKHAICALSEEAEVLHQGTVPNSRESLTRLSRRYPGALFVMEVGMHSPWTSRFLQDLVHRHGNYQMRCLDFQTILVPEPARRTRGLTMGVFPGTPGSW